MHLEARSLFVTRIAAVVHGAYGTTGAIECWSCFGQVKPVQSRAGTVLYRHVSQQWHVQIVVALTLHAYIMQAIRWWLCRLVLVHDAYSFVRQASDHDFTV